MINILTHRKSSQREEIKQYYKNLYGRVIYNFEQCLIERSIAELYDPLEYLGLCLLYVGSDADAYILKHATFVINI